MKLSLASILLQAIEEARGPVKTFWLVQIASDHGYKHPRAATHNELKNLRKYGWIKVHSPGRGSFPATWLPTVSRIPVRGPENTLAGRKGEG